MKKLILTAAAILLSGTTLFAEMLIFDGGIKTSTGVSLAMERPDSGYRTTEYTGVYLSSAFLLRDEGHFDHRRYGLDTISHISYGVEASATLSENPKVFENPYAEKNVLFDVLPTLSLQPEKYPSISLNLMAGYSFGTYGDTRQSGFTYGLSLDKMFEELDKGAQEGWFASAKLLSSHLEYSNNSYPKDVSGNSLRFGISMGYLFR